MLGRRYQIRQCLKDLSARTLSKLLVSFQLAVISDVTAFASPETACKVTLCFCSHLSIHPSDARKSVNSRLLARLRAFSLITFPLTRRLFERTFLNQVKTTSSRSLASLFFNFLLPGSTWPDTDASMIFFLFAIHVDFVFSFTPYSSATLFLFFFCL